MNEDEKVITLGRVKISLPQLLDHVGQTVYITTRMVSNCDPNIAYGVWLERLELLENCAVVLRGLYEQLEAEWAGYLVRLPIDIGMVVTPNPLYEEESQPSQPDSRDGVDGGLGDIPF